MATISKFAGTVSQTTGGHYVTFSNLSNIRNSTSGSWAVSSVLIQGKGENKNRPSSISCTNFGFNLPVGAEVKKVKVLYRYRKVAGSDYSSKYPKRICNIPAPTISLLGVSGQSGKGVSPTTTMTTNTKTFNVAGKVSRTQVNSSGFGVKINWPTNTNKWNGYLRVSYVKIEVEYVLSSYGVSVKKVSGGYNNEDYTVELSISNRNSTSYNPSLTLSSPSGFSFKSSSGTGSLVQNSARSFTWDPKLGSNVGTSSINVVFDVDVTYPSGQSSYSGTFSLSESLNGASNSHTAVITERPPSEQEEEEEGSKTITDEDSIPNVSDFIDVVVNEEVDVYLEELKEKIMALHPGSDVDELSAMPFIFPINPSGEIIFPTTSNWESPLHLQNNVFTYYDNGEYINNYYWMINELDASTLVCSELGIYAIIIYDSLTTPIPEDRYYSSYGEETPLAVIHIKCKPDEDDLTIPNFTVLEPSEEELNRLGDGYPYVVQSDMKHTTEDEYQRDWYKNNRIGVFNNAITENITITTETDPETGEVTETITDTTDYENLTTTEIIENAEYWSESIAGLNEYDNVECEFTYNEDYPLYLIFTGDYPETTTYGYDMGSITYNNPSITEKTVYKEREQTGNYPVPIGSLIDDSDSAELTIPTLNTSTPVILYGLPLDDGYGNTDTMHIRGMSITGTIEQSDELVLSAKLTTPQGISGTRTIVINDQDTTIDSDNEFTIGGLGDLWGFTQAEMQNLDDWELELTVSNLLNDGDANINLTDVMITFYTETIDQQLINIKVQNEDLSFYGAFVENVEIPEGLETDTDFLTIDGTDTNDAYRQNIREKTIELELSIGECDLETSTLLLRQLTALLVNEKDAYNRPIPKTIEFSHYPDVYYEYIMKDALDITQDMGAYKIKAKLVVPAGTSYSNDTKTTNITGFVQGVASVNPVITVKPQADQITITETVTQQSFTMGYSGDWQTGIVEIDCEDRKAYLKTNEDDTTPVDISKYVDFQSDWFRLKGEYSFTGAGCVIRTVEYLERW